ncbi:hypothetical protein AS189_03065 [Arthrobacter alpinus]|uniref:RDD domain-containing protein n=1 Tax=Arthrobacter alpinus TaxID=656366 RepID=A0A0S2LVW0_9MICC|nr:RDD family protein [Arthrobacter alpinus]ALO65657.1 hypothetical protein AS189_03065 [Arthrobacter alpinus]
MSFPPPHPSDNRAAVPVGSWNPKRTAQFGNGTWGVRASDGKLIGAWALDFAVVIALALVVALAVGKNGAATAIVAGVGAWIASSWIYGFLCLRGHTLGTLAAGTQLVKLRDGSAPGFWRSGWLMFLRTVLFPGWLIVILFAILGAGDPDVASKSTYHASIDKQQTRALRAAQAPGWN